ncbi:MAG: polysaccharide biosynthesis C-terminal domain-containing protein [Oscillospiraceae bacterium]|nr:polysaccharide biosynthesis C-terminal domain-containing protein [Oscillospiraceae bacterium]
MRIQLSEHFTYAKLLRFTFPSIVMMIFTSIYSVVDGVFVSNFAGKTPFAAVNLIMPLLIITGAPGFMVGTGGSAIVAKTMGQGKAELANRYFSFLVCAAAVGGAAVGWLGFAFARPTAIALGADGEMLEYCVLYARIILAANPFFILQNVFQSFLIAAEKPKLGLCITVGAGLTNIVLDAVMVGVFRWGVAGAALATILSQAVGGLTPVVYFLRKNSSLLRLVRPRFDGRVLWKTCSNGSSELMSNISGSVVAMLYNFQLLRLAGEDGVAAYGAIMYVNFIFAAIFIGYAIGSAPVISFHYGAEHSGELHSLLGKSTVINAAAGVVMTGAALALAGPMSKIFVGYDQELYELTVRGFRLYAISFLLCGLNIFGSSFFTALNNGLASAAISFLRTLVFQCASVLILPIFLDVDGIWLAISVAEAAALAVTAALLAVNRKVYRY